MLLASVCLVVVTLSLWRVVAWMVERSPARAPRRVKWMGAGTATGRVRRRLERRPHHQLDIDAPASVDDTDEGPWFC